jgi:hypothetical protein
VSATISKREGQATQKAVSAAVVKAAALTAMMADLFSLS